MTHLVTLVTRKGGFHPTYVDKDVKCRLLKTMIVLENGDKYKKSNGKKVNGHSYMGVYLEDTRVEPNTVREI